MHFGDNFCILARVSINAPHRHVVIDRFEPPDSSFYNQQENEMKIFPIITFALIMTQSGYAAITRCLPLSANTPCTGGMNSTDKVEWSTTCNNTPVHGIGLCSNTSAATVGATGQPTLTYSNNVMYCWCKMIYPAVSSWVFALSLKYLEGYNPGPADQCTQECSNKCNDLMNAKTTDGTNFRKAIFQGLYI